MRRRNEWTTSGPRIAAAIVAAGVCAAAHADGVDDLRAQIEALRKQVIELERKQAEDARRAADAAVTAGSTKGSFKLPGSNTSVTLGGYVKLDAVYSNPSAGVDSTADLFLQPNAIAVGPAAGRNERGQVKLGARESRAFVRTSTPSAWGDVVTYVEGDFYGGDGNESVSNSHGLRLRHAYGSLGPLLGGQTWTNFMFVPSLPETLDFGGPVGQIFVRQAQLRWTQPFRASANAASGGPRGQWSIALENPETVVTLADGAAFRADDDRFPDVTAQVMMNAGRARVAVSGLLRQLRSDSASPQLVAQRWGGGASVAAVVPTVGNDDVRFTVSAGNAIGRYSNGFFPDAVAAGDGSLRLPTQWGWFAAYRHFWSERLRSTVVLSAARENNPSAAPATTNKSTQSAHANLIWTPVANTDVGVEYIHASRETQDGLKGRLDRLQVSAKYTF